MIFIVLPYFIHFTIPSLFSPLMKTHVILFTYDYFQKVSENFMQLDSTSLYLLAKDLKTSLLSSQVRQIHQINHRMFDFELFRPDAAPAHLVMNTSSPAYVYTLNKNIYKSQYIPSQTFCMTLRKHLEGSRLSDVMQPDLDRILIFSFDRIEAGGRIVTKKLYLELLPASPNLILTENGKIIDACLKGTRGNRHVAVGEAYVFPNYSNRLNFLLFSREELLEQLEYACQDSEENKIVEQYIFSSYNGFSRYLVDELCLRCGLSPADSLKSLTEIQRSRIADEIFHLGQEIQDSQMIYIYQTNAKSEFTSPIILTGQEKEKEDTILHWLESELQNPQKVISAELKDYEKMIHRCIKKEIRKKQKIQDELKETEYMEKYKLWGNLLAIYSYEKIKGKKEITVSNLFADPPEDETIPVDPLKSVIINSQNYFKKYNKMKTRLVYSKEKEKECDTRIQYLNNLTYFMSRVTSLQEINELKQELKSVGIEKQKSSGKKSNHDKQSRQISIKFNDVDGFRVYSGENNIQNEYLTVHKAQKDDIWLHAKGYPGSHVVIDAQHHPVPMDILEKAAVIAAANSQGRTAGKVEVDYTLVKYVKKVPGTPPGFVTFSHQKTLVVTPES